MRIVVALLSFALIATPAVAFHRSVGGDIAANFPPAQEVGGPDVTETLTYDNTADPDLLSTYQRTAPPDQSYAPGSGIGYFDVVRVEYAGAYQITIDDSIDVITDDEPGDHPATYSPNLVFGLPPLASLNGVSPVPLGSGHQVMYPTQTYFYAYAFGDGTAKNAEGDNLVAGQGIFAGLIDSEACASRTVSCQLLRPADLDGLVAGKPGQQAAMCGWDLAFHMHPGANVATCRDFDFGYLSDNVADLGAQNQPESATWVNAGIPGWYGNVVLVDAGVIWAIQQYIEHYTIGAAFDPAVGPPTNLGTGNSPLACVEPGFDVTKYLAHDVDIYDPPVQVLLDTVDFVNATVDAAIDEAVRTLEDSPAGPVVQFVADTVDEQLETVDGLLGPVADSAVAAVNTAVAQGINTATENPRQVRPFYSVDTHGLIDVRRSERFDCIGSNGAHNAQGLVQKFNDDRHRNWLDMFIWHGTPVTGGTVSVRDPFELAAGNDAHENPGGGVFFYWTNPNQQSRPALGQYSLVAGQNVPMFDGYYDNNANFGAACTAAGSFGPGCLGDAMHLKGYRDPTALFFVVKFKGPVAFFNWNNLQSPVFATYTDAGTDTHCAVGATKGVFSNDGQDLVQTQSLQPILADAGFTTSLTGLTAAQEKEVLRTTLCGGATTIDLIPGAGFNVHPAGNSVTTPFSWAIPTGWVDSAKGQVDLFYVVSVAKAEGLTGDRICLNLVTTTCPSGDPTATVVSQDANKVTHVWQHRTKIGSGATAS